MRSRRNLEFESTDSEDELPKVDRHYKPTFEKQDFLKMFQQKNAIHSGIEKISLKFLVTW